jgi:hypothetical protein
VDQAARVAYIQSQVVCALAEIEAMRAANAAATLKPGGTGIVYGMDDFRDVPGRFGIDHNAVIAYLAEGR